MAIRTPTRRALALLCAWLALPIACATGFEAVAATSIEPAYSDLSPHGPRHAQGVVVYSHGRSLTGENSESPSPAYLRYLAKAGWDVLRFNRPSSEDTLEASSDDLARRAAGLKAQGYKRVILTGQSFGAFLSIMAAEITRSVDGVVATSPAAFGSFSDSFDTWRMNATELYADLAKLRRVHVLLAFFHGDEYDPGGRGEQAQAILARNGVFGIVIDQPRDLVGHLAAATPQFAKRYGPCLIQFMEGAGNGAACEDSTVVRPDGMASHQISESTPILSTGGTRGKSSN